MYNLLIHNVPEDQAPVMNTVRRILSEMGIIDANLIMIDVAHRLGQASPRRPRPIIFRLLMKSDRNRIWQARTTLNKTKLYMSEDYPEDYKRQRNLLKPVLSAAKSSGAKATLVGNKIRVEGKLYSADQIDDLPPEIIPERGCTSENKDVLCFFGRYSPLSNFYKCSFNFNGRSYNCIEQFLQSRKAELLGDDATAQKILRQEDPADQKRIAKNLKDPQGQWSKVAQLEVKLALKEKFTQNPDIHDYLIATGNKVLAEASFDMNWGVGLSLRNPQVMDKNLWQGKNWLGNVLMAVRQDLS